MEAPSQPSNFYARVLRAIGQDIGDLFPHQLEIEQKERSFVVHVRCDRKRSEGKRPAQPAETQKSGLRGIFQKLHSIRLNKPSNKPDIVSVNRVYNPIDISRIDEAGLQKRNQLGKIPDIHDLGEALRTIGRVLDAAEGRLVKVLKDQRGVVFEYIERGGGMKKVKLTRAELVKVQQSYYHGREGSGSLDLWRNKD